MYHTDGFNSTVGSSCCSYWMATMALSMSRPLPVWWLSMVMLTLSTVVVVLVVSDGHNGTVRLVAVNGHTDTVDSCKSNSIAPMVILTLPVVDGHHDAVDSFLVRFQFKNPLLWWCR
jgi:hypothetical protein